MLVHSAKSGVSHERDNFFTIISDSFKNNIALQTIKEGNEKNGIRKNTIPHKKQFFSVLKLIFSYNRNNIIKTKTSDIYGLNSEV